MQYLIEIIRLCNWTTAFAVLQVSAMTNDKSCRPTQAVISMTNILEKTNIKNI